MENASIDAVFSLAERCEFNSGLWLSELLRILKPMGVLVVQEPQTVDKQTKSALDQRLLMAGFISLQQCPAYAEIGNSCVAVRAVKPAWNTGASFSLKRRPYAVQDPSAKIQSTVRKLSADETDDVKLEGISNQSSVGGVFKLPTYEVDGDLVDEDTLLTEEDLKRPELPKVDDCEVGKAGRKACKNCTCGRAEKEESGKMSLTTEELNNPQSACGSCGLGDAFRCGSCPYKGMPPFKLGDKITLSGTLLTADV